MRNLITIIATVLIATTATAQNQNATATQTAKLAMSNAIDITFTATGNNNGGTVNMAFSNVNDYANGVESSQMEIKVRSNKKFVVKAKTTSNNFTYTGNTTPAPVMPVKKKLWIKVTDNNTGGNVHNKVDNKYRSLRANNRKLVDNCTPGGNNTFKVQYKATPGFEYPAGTYTVDVLYTATQK